MKVIQILFAIVFGGVGLLMSACGLFFTVGGAANVIAVIAIVIGAGLCWLATLLWKAGYKSGAPPTDGGSTGAGSD